MAIQQNYSDEFQMHNSNELNKIVLKRLTCFYSQTRFNDYGHLYLSFVQVKTLSKGIFLKLFGMIYL